MPSNQDMLEKHVFLSNYDWFSLWRSNQAIATALAERGRLLFVPFSASIPRALRYVDDRRQLRDVIRRRHLSQVTIGPRLELYRPVPLFHFGHRQPKLLEWQIQAVTYMAAKACPEAFGPNVVVWSSSPFMYAAKKALPQSRFVYYVVDDERFLHGPKRREIIERAERKSAAVSNLVVVASDALRERFDSYGARTHLEYVGAPALSQVPESLPPSVLAKLQGLPQPRICFLGTLRDDYVDFPLLTKTARCFSKGSLVFVGPIESHDSFRQLAALGNVHHINTVPHQCIQAVLQLCDVCILPFLANEVTKAADPMKMYYYLAARRPTVAVRTGIGMDRFKEAVSLTTSHDEFIGSLQRAIASPNGDSMDHGVRIVAAQSWPLVAERIAVALSRATSGDVARGDRTHRE